MTGVDATIAQLVLGVAANAATSLLMPLMRQGMQGLAKRSELFKSLANYQFGAPATASLMRAAFHDLDIDEKVPRNRQEDVRRALKSGAAEQVVRQIFSIRLAPAGGHKASIATIKEEFKALFMAHCELGTDDENAELAESLFESALAAAEFLLSEEINRGNLSALDAKQSAQNKLLLGELENISKNVKTLTKTTVSDTKAYYEFERKYRRQISFASSKIVPPQLETADKVDIRKIYVEPSLSEWPIAAGKKARRHFSAVDDAGEWRSSGREVVSYNEFLSGSHRAVILGNPGAGKSTLATKICFDLAADSGQRLLAGRVLTPVIILLREYEHQFLERGTSIHKYIEEIAASRYQVVPPHGAIEYLLLNGHLLVIFDGLDELIDTSLRQKIRDNVELFCNGYPAVPVMVTSRFVGYEEAPLDHNVFRAWRIENFSEKQVADYAQKWFKIQFAEEDADVEPTAEAFVRESGVAPDLRSNPLMLGLMCNIYRGEKYIPQNRPEVFKKCSEMLFDRWDRSRGLRVPLPFEAHVRPAMTHLAYWLYTKRIGGVTEEHLVEKTAGYLFGRAYDDRDEAASAAREFISFCRGRAWVFTDTGTTASGESLYQFTHRTFLEYFAALYLVRINPTPAKLLGQIVPKAARREWDVVTQLAVQVQSTNNEDAADKLLSGILRAAANTYGLRQWNLLSFAARSLEFLVPSPAVKRRITRNIFERFLVVMDAAAAKAKTKPKDPGHASDEALNRAQESLVMLLVTSKENTITVTAEAAKVIASRLSVKSFRRRENALDLILQWPDLVPMVQTRTDYRGRNIEIYEQMVRRLLAENRARVAELATVSRRVSYFLVSRLYRDVRDHVRDHGLDGLLKTSQSFTCPRAQPMSAVALWMVVVALPPRAWKAWIGAERVMELVKSFGDLFVERKYQVSFSSRAVRRALGFNAWRYHLRENLANEQDSPTMTAGVAFGAVCLLMVYVEAILTGMVHLPMGGAKPLSLDEFRKVLAPWVCRDYGDLIQRRLDFRLQQGVQQELRVGESPAISLPSCCQEWSSEQMSFLTNWAAGSTSLVRPVRKLATGTT